MGNLYEIKLADGDCVTYESNKTLDELKSWISENDFIELPRSGIVQIKNGVKFVPKLALYQTKSIVYIDHDISAEHCRYENNKTITKVKPIINKIFAYNFNKKMRRWIWWNIDVNINNLTEEDLYFRGENFLNKMLNKCKKYKCNLKKEG